MPTNSPKTSASAQATEKPTAQASGNTPASPAGSTAAAAEAKRSGNPVVVVLLVLIAVLLAVIAALLFTRPTANNKPAAEAGATASTAPQAGGQAEPQAGPAQPGAGTAAPEATDQKLLNVMHQEVKRDPADGQAKGKVDAPVVLVLYSDFACPYCTLFAQQVQPALQDLVDNGTLRVEWRDLAQITETSPLAAQAGLAAAAQGKFWEFHDAVYAAADPKGHPSYSEESLVGFATQAGVPDLEAFKTKLNAPETKQAVEQAKQHTYSIGVQGTPFMIINNAFINGYKDGAYVRATVLDQAAKAGH
ncbi:Thiol-disulfide oxidoreductase D [Actinomyces bovis]|uniref:Thiol-disulfide oxidoreductase D n=1 Tax=Actinomyces bovis TaxID=1658 RepID=A0ABY1VRX0_9ACTO|nr:thioredoxin domain-containing protein [Actinomyces bovis]SPT54422.1 Thiol-disulfide oxidoreductase D [Actinomyces bovis]VEG55991.1 Thiol-disulfide oxidoreductase D [Actinomyces israelii]